MSARQIKMTNRSQIPQTNHRQIWLSLLFGFIVWFVYLNIVYPLTSLTCRWGWFPFNILGLPGLRFIQMVITVIALLLIARMIYLPWRNWKRIEASEEDKFYQTAKDPHSLMMLVSMLLNTLFGLFIIVSFVPMFALNPCL
jgi:hypothetical protein